MSKWGKTKTFLLSQHTPQTDRETYFVIHKIPSDENPYHYEIPSTASSLLLRHFQYAKPLGITR